MPSPQRLQTGQASQTTRRQDAASVRVEDVQRARLLAATVDATAELGADNLTVSEVVSRAGVSRRTFYQLFDSAEDCLLAAFDDAVDWAAAHVVPAYRSEERWIDAVDAAVLALLAFFDAQSATARLLVVEALAAGPKVLQRRQSLLRDLAKAIAKGADTCRGCDPPAVTPEALVGGIVSIVHSRLVAPRPRRLLPLASELVSLILLPYLDAKTRARELPRPARKLSQLPQPLPSAWQAPVPESPKRPQIQLRLTHRTMLVLLALAEHPDASNREIGDAAGIRDQGQVSKLLRRLERAGIVTNGGAGAPRGSANAWTLTPAGRDLATVVASSSASPRR